MMFNVPNYVRSFSPEARVICFGLPGLLFLIVMIAFGLLLLGVISTNRYFETWAVVMGIGGMLFFFGIIRSKVGIRVIFVELMDGNRDRTHGDRTLGVSLWILIVMLVPVILPAILGFRPQYP